MTRCNCLVVSLSSLLLAAGCHTFESSAPRKPDELSAGAAAVSFAYRGMVKKAGGGGGDGGADDELKIGKCEACKGTGKVSDHAGSSADCNVCGGDGRIDQDDLDRQKTFVPSQPVTPQPAVAPIEEPSVPLPPIVWLDPNSALATAIAQGKHLVLLHVSSNTKDCENCLIMDAQVYPDQRVIAALRPFAPVKIGKDHPWVAKYGVRSQPVDIFAKITGNKWQIVSPIRDELPLEPAAYAAYISQVAAELQ